MSYWKGSASILFIFSVILPLFSMTRSVEQASLLQIEIKINYITRFSFQSCKYESHGQCMLSFQENSPLNTSRYNMCCNKKTRKSKGCHPKGQL